MQNHKKRMKNIKGVLTKKDLKFPKKDTNQDATKISSLRYGN